jgi:hypothetical protein
MNAAESPSPASSGAQSLPSWRGESFAAPYSELWAMVSRIDERQRVHLDGMQRFGDRLDTVESRIRGMETVEKGSTMRSLEAEIARLRDRVERLQDVQSGNRPVIEGAARLAGWVVAAVVAMVFAALQFKASL